MTITLGSTTLVAGQVRSQDGSPIGPTDLVIDLAPGVEIRSYVGADRVTGEHVRCDHGTVTFGATRTFATPEAALAYMRTTFLSEDSAGAPWLISSPGTASTSIWMSMRSSSGPDTRSR